MIKNRNINKFEFGGALDANNWYYNARAKEFQTNLKSLYGDNPFGIDMSGIQGIVDSSWNPNYGTTPQGKSSNGLSNALGSVGLNDIMNLGLNFISAFKPKGNVRQSSTTDIAEGLQSASGAVQNSPIASHPVAQLGSALTDTVANILIEKNTGYESRGQANVATATNSLMSGAKLGAAGLAIGGPVGGAIGAVAGIASGLIGGKSKTTDNGFYEDPTIEYGSGLLGKNSRKAAEREYNILKQRASGNRVNKYTSANVAARFAENDTNAETNLFAEDGGNVSGLAYVDDGELLKTPQGNISYIPEQGNDTDENLVTIPDKTRVLSDTLKVPGTNETFAKMGKRLMSKPSKGKDRYARGSEEANKLNDEIVFDKLFDIQESMKSKKNTNEFVTGGEYDDNLVLQNWLKANNSSHPNILYNRFTDVYPTQNGWILNGDYSIPTVQKTNTNKTANGRSISRRVTPVASKSTFSMPDFSMPTQSFGVSESTLPTSLDYVPTSTSLEGGVDNDGLKLNFEDILNGIGSIASSIGELYPAIRNTKAKPEVFNPVFNPYSETALRIMGSRRYNVEPTINELRRANASSNYAASQYNSNTGANLAFRLQNAVKLNNAIANAYAQASEMNNRYKGEYASALDNAGRQSVAASNLAIDQNARSRAAAEKIKNTGYAQIAQWLQLQKQMRNQKKHDSAMLDLYKPFLQTGFTVDDYAKLLKQYGG